MEKEFAQYLNNKRLVIVGPASYVYDIKNGNNIDSYDVVLRIKKSFPVLSEHYDYIGKKTNVLISHLKVKCGKHNYFQNNFNLNSCEVFNNNLNFILFPYPRVKHFDRFVKNFKKDFKNITIPLIYPEDNTIFNNIKNNINNYDDSEITGLNGSVKLLTETWLPIGSRTKLILTPPLTITNQTVTKYRLGIKSTEWTCTSSEVEGSKYTILYTGNYDMKDYIDKRIVKVNRFGKKGVLPIVTNTYLFEFMESSEASDEKKKNFNEWNQKMNEFFKILCDEDYSKKDELKACLDELKTLTDNITRIIFLKQF